MSYSSEVLADGPVGYWRFGESSGTTATDSSGNGRDGTYVNNPTLGQTGALAGDSDTAVLFDTAGGSDQMSVPHSAALAITGDLTLEVWAKITTPGSGFQNLASKGTNGSPWLWYSNNGTGLLRFASAFPSNVESTAAPTAGTFCHLAVTRSGTTITHYLNGATNGTGTLATTTDDGSALLVADHASVGALTGTLDELAVYNTALSGARILAHFNAAASASPVHRSLVPIPFM